MPSQDQYSELKKLVQQLSVEQNAILFLDTNHFSPEIREAFNSVQPILRENSNRTILLEGPVLLNALMSGIEYTKYIPSARNFALKTLFNHEIKYHDSDPKVEFDNQKRALEIATGMDPLRAMAVNDMLEEAGLNTSKHKQYVDTFLETITQSDHGSTILFADERYNEEVILAATDAIGVMNKYNFSINVNDPDFEQKYNMFKECVSDEDRKKLERMKDVGDFLGDNKHNISIAGNFRSLSGYTDKMNGLYGFAHFMRRDDLDELFTASTIALADFPGNPVIVKAMKEKPEEYTDLPEYVYYISENRVVKLDTDAAKEEFLGREPDQSNLTPLTCNDVIHYPFKDSESPETPATPPSPKKTGTAKVTALSKR